MDSGARAATLLLAAAALLVPGWGGALAPGAAPESHPTTPCSEAVVAAGPAVASVEEPILVSPCERTCSYRVVRLASPQVLGPVCPWGDNLWTSVSVFVSTDSTEGAGAFLARGDGFDGRVIAQCTPLQVGLSDYECLLSAAARMERAYLVFSADMGPVETGVVRYGSG